MSRSSYVASLAAAFGLIGYLYLVDFGRVSETDMVRFSYLWVFLIVYGLYGLIAIRLERFMEPGADAHLGRAVEKWFDAVPVFRSSRPLRLLVLLFLLPMVVAAGILKAEDPSFRAAIGALVMLLVHTFFLRMAFPGL